MFTRSRPCLKRCGPSAIITDYAAGRQPQPNEPLLFLYPRWFTTAVRQQRGPIDSLLLCNNGRSCTSRGCLPCSASTRPRTRKQLSVASAKKRWLSTSSTPMLSKAESADSTEADSKPKSPPTDTRTDAVDGEETKPAKDKWLFDAFTDLLEGPYIGVDSSLVEREFQTRKEGDFQPRRNRQEWRGSPLRPAPREELQKYKDFVQQLPPRQGRRILRRQFSLRDMEPKQRDNIYYILRKFLERLEIHGRKRDLHAPGFNIDPEDSEKREIFVPDETIAVFAGISQKFSQSENIWFERVGSGCRVHVSPVSESEGENRKVVIWGSSRATEIVADRFLNTKQQQEQADPLVEIQKPVVPVFPSRLALQRNGVAAPLIRGVWAARSTKRPPVLIDHLNLKGTMFSTVKEFAEHVEALTISLPSPTASTYHPARVAGRLFRLFDDESRRHLISTTALNIAVSYYLEHEYLSLCQALLAEAQSFMTTETANILLKSFAKKQDLQRMKNTLRLMDRLRIRPDIDSWLTYADCLISPAAKIEFVNELKEKGYVENKYAMRRVLQVMAQDIFTIHLMRGRSVADFFDKVIWAIGNSVSPSLTVQLFNVTAQLKDRAAMMQLVEVYKKHHLPLPSQVAHEIIQFFPKDAFSAVYYTLRCLESTDADLDAKTYEALFLSAFNSKYYNISRVLWRYACLNNKVTRPMRSTMQFLLMQNVARSDLKEREKLWWTCAAKVIVGVALHLPDYPLKKELLEIIPPDFHDDPVASLVSLRQLEGKERQQQRIRAKAIIKHDCQIGPWYRPIFPLGHLLQAALEQDMEWQGLPRPARWLMNHAIQIPLEYVGHDVGNKPPADISPSKFWTIRPSLERRRDRTPSRRVPASS